VNAETVIVSSGYKNRFHHPAKIVQERYQNFGMAMLNTAEVGAVKIRLTDMGIDIEKALCAQRFFWREARYNAHCSP
jgi:competence protein ComEC